MSFALAILRQLFPFLKEMILGDRTLMQTLKYDTRRVFFLFFVCFIVFSAASMFVPTLHYFRIKFSNLDPHELQERIVELENELLVCKLQQSGLLDQEHEKSSVEK